MPESADNQKPTLVSMEESSCVDLSEVDLICADMDGTLVSPFHTIPDVRWFRLQGDAELQLADCLGDLALICKRYSRPGIYLNGSVIYDHTGAVAAEKKHDIADVWRSDTGGVWIV
ncbi:hypothetical protein Pmar_PMAR019322 [Perkinsus marinus ATCC 50983]|uniref:Uncharacterized protein n=1 Tax=Perkinsus marinus (strain ATCC 50983 / TXsc) TaxID=423536 RepID=C5KFU0_PERM5|nr:hypothetical protein Pmar_PMAR019322 [Perkinsus marinus ATCC 50983]EER16642.1 hypothetical protein Pmar_PMAR019322 [Perkinsus marinus ATCC 50983]|eukprot:XP_002784846.1 hypothetical protein Pmar_PMAR019322 [Perkinsus marinus ATCC 50983]